MLYILTFIFRNISLSVAWNYLWFIETFKQKNATFSSLMFLCCIFPWCIFLVAFFVLYLFLVFFHVEFICVEFSHVVFFSVVLKSFLLLTDSSDIWSSYFWLDSKEKSFSLGWETRNDLLPCNLPVYILKLSDCKLIEISVDFLPNFANL